MRRLWLTLCGLALIGGGLVAQQPAVPQPDPTKMLDFVLGQWEQTMTNLQELHLECSRKEVDKVFKTTKFFKGTAKLRKGRIPSEPCQAYLHLERYTVGPKGVYDVKTNTYEKFICSGTFLYEFVPSDKEIRIHAMRGPVADNFLSFFIGMKAADAKRRYQIRWVPAPPPGNQFYHYLLILPRANNKSDFTEARLTLSAKTFLPRQLWYQEANGNEITWDCPKVLSNVDIRAADFAKPAPPAGWKFSNATEEKPRVVRPAAP